jgi:exonuclease VII small subunit
VSELEELIAELEETARRLRGGELGGDEAAALVERCAELAAKLDSELEQQARAARAEGLPGQEKLL